MFIRWIGLTISLLTMYVSIGKFNPAGVVAGVFLTAYFLYKILFEQTKKDNNEGD